MNKPSNTIFKEEQRFRLPLYLFFIITLFVIALFGNGMFQQLVLGHPWGNKPMPDGRLAVIGIIQIVIVTGIFVIFFAARLITEVRSDGLYMRFIPFHRSFRSIPFETLKTYEACTYRPIRDAGGYGIHRGRRGWAYNVSGNRGVQLELVSGKRILIGSQRPDELVQAIDTATGRHQNNPET
ncbi:MAG: DUF6141 family protein [Deltaproteobacteria bacterium]|nr:DUF6141 family protein [Deltaproteobacteria bacterium]